MIEWSTRNPKLSGVCQCISIVIRASVNTASTQCTIVVPLFAMTLRRQCKHLDTVCIVHLSHILVQSLGGQWLYWSWFKPTCQQLYSSSKRIEFSLITIWLICFVSLNLQQMIWFVRLAYFIGLTHKLNALHLNRISINKTSTSYLI